ncbi:MAG: NnrS family protein [Rhodocyclaceae bacterium]|nr:NnrS family protein [Rhodocyclaceae bacterium]
MTRPTLFAAPHRPLFAFGILQALLVMLLWAHELAARLGFWTSLAWPLPPTWWHGLLMIHGVFVFLIFGFIMTAGPRWQGAPEVRPGIYLPTALVMACGWVLTYIGLAVRALFMSGLAVLLVGWLVGLVGLVQLCRHPNPDRGHVLVVTGAVGLGALSLAGMLAFAAGASSSFATASLTLGIWGFLLPVFFTVCHRMLPFFSSSSIPNYRVIRPRWTLWFVLASSLGHAGFVLAGLEQMLWLVDLPAALVTAWLVAVWGFWASFVNRMLSVLHVAFAWLPLALLLSALSSLMFWLGQGSLGLAPLHALTLGCFTSLVVGMGSRVTLGHSGRPIVADRVMWGCFWAIQLAALVRIGAELLAGAGALSLLAALIWLGAFVIWAWHYGPALWKPREDGLPG